VTTALQLPTDALIY